MQIKNTNERLFHVVNSADFKKLWYHLVPAMAGRYFFSPGRLRAAPETHSTQGTDMAPQPRFCPDPHARPFQGAAVRLVPVVRTALEVSALLTMGHWELYLWATVEQNRHLLISAGGNMNCKHFLKSYVTRSTLF